MLRLLVLLYYYHKNKKDRQKRNKLFPNMGVSSSVEKSPWLPLAIFGR